MITNKIYSSTKRFQFSFHHEEKDGYQQAQVVLLPLPPQIHSSEESTDV